ncbi:hypothetical protein E2C01_006170 [Portunus trituberculatus]|uniref:Secreted protein n=1 Tax=Portunus trituberculatus TaxID=210409 RepID=A0A5B7CWD2_PORTR|nr:hypothetical protein [Portunus trituberculatus]
MGPRVMHLLLLLLVASASARKLRPPRPGHDFIGRVSRCIYRKPHRPVHHYRWLEALSPQPVYRAARIFNTSLRLRCYSYIMELSNT